MTEAKHSDTAASPAQLNLVNSSRLQSLRKQSLASETDNKQPSTKPNPQEDAESIRLRNQVNQRLAEILAKLPAGKQRSLFKIRFGVEIDELQQMPAKQAAAILKLTPSRR